MKLLLLCLIFLSACGGQKPPVIGPKPLSQVNQITTTSTAKPSDSLTDGTTDSNTDTLTGYPPGLEHLATLDSVTEEIIAIHEFLNTIGYDWHSFTDKPSQLADKACLFAENLDTITASCALLKNLNAEEECLNVDSQLGDILAEFSKRSKIIVKNKHLDMVVGQKPYKDLEVEITWQLDDGSSIYWEGAKVIFDAPPGLLNQEEWLTDSQGHIVNEFQHSAPAEQTIRLSLAPFACNELANRWLPPFESIVLNELNSATAKIELFFAEEVGQNPAIHQIFTETLLSEFYRLGLNGARILGEYDSLMLKNYRGQEAEALAYLQSRQKKGHLLIFGTVNSDFISRVGARSMWHEAVANIKIIDEATNTEIYSGSLSGRATGIGEQDAADNAMSQLAKSIAEDPLVAAIRNYLIK